VDGGASVLTSADGDRLSAAPLPLLPGRYGDYYAAVRDALLGPGSNPVTPEDACLVMALLELGQASQRAGCEMAWKLPPLTRRAR
jgi:scyllo-inositol 2-dehydrogenase (NADP+)